MNVIKQALYLLGRCLSPMCPEDVGRWARPLSLVFTGTRAGKFASWGEGSVMRYKPSQLRGLRHVRVGRHCLFEAGLELTAWETPSGQAPEVTIGDHCVIRKDAQISAVRRVVIGNHLLTGTHVLISDNAHGESKTSQTVLPPTERPLFSKGEIVIGDNVWMGNGACVLGNVHIGDGAVIGANAVVTHDVPAHHMAVGAPARIMKIKD